MSTDRSFIDVPRRAPHRVPIVPRVTLPGVDEAGRAIIAAANLAAADREVSTRRRLESLLAAGKHVYPLTVSPKEIARRRAVNKRARIARRAARA